MKSKKLSKKLSFNRETIANLGDEKMDSAQGGIVIDRSLVTCFTICTCPASMCPKTDCGDSWHTPCYC